MTMKFKSIKHLNAEKKRLQQRRDELEKAIKYDWRDLKDSLRPRNVANQVFSKVFDGKKAEDGSDYLADKLSGFAASITRKIVEKLEDKIGHWFKK